MTVQTPK